MRFDPWKERTAELSLVPWTGAPRSPGFSAKLDGVGELHAAFLTESRTRRCWMGPRTENPGRPSVRGLKGMGEALLLFLGDRAKEKSNGKEPFSAHVRWGERGAPVQELGLNPVDQQLVH